MKYKHKTIKNKLLFLIEREIRVLLAEPFYDCYTGNETIYNGYFENPDD